MEGLCDHHIGFGEGAPGEVKWSEGSYVRPVELHERRNWRPYALVFLVGWFGLICIAGVLLAARRQAGRPEAGGMDILDLASVLCMLFGFTLCVFSGHLSKLILIRSARSRPNRLFEPNWECIYVLIESSGSFDKVKLLTEDVGLLNVYTGALEIEMTGYRARLAADDVSVGIHGVAKASGVQLLCDLGEWPWEVTLVAPFQARNILMAGNPNKKAKWLLKRIESGLAKSEL